MTLYSFKRGLPAIIYSIIPMPSISTFASIGLINKLYLFFLYIFLKPKLVDRKNLWKGKPIKSLVFGKRSTGGRNNLGRITSRSKGAGHKNKYRIVDFHRKKDDLKAKIERIEYDPNRSAHIALIKYEDGTMNYVLAPNKIKIGDEINLTVDCLGTLRNKISLM